MRRDYFSSLEEKDEKDVTPTWIFRSTKVILKLKNNEVEDFYKSYEGMSSTDIENYFKNLHSWEVKSEQGYALGNFHSCMILHAGPLHHKLKHGEPMNMEEEEKKDEYVYGGGFSSLDEEDIKFLNENGYIVVNGPEGPECRLA